MELSGLFTTTAPSTPEKLYIAIVLTESSVQSALWKVMSGEVIPVHRSKLHTFTDEKECLVATDESLRELGKESESVNQVVFGLQPSWVEADDVAPAKQKLLDKITSELSLEAVGFVVITEAVIHHVLHSHPNVSALFLHLSSELLSVTLVLQGQPVQSEHVGRSNDVVADVTEALARIQARVQPAQAFPAKFFVFSGDLTQEQLFAEEQTLIDQDWLDRGFLQPPVTELLSPALILDAVVDQGGKVVAVAEGLASSEPVVSSTPDFEFDEVSFTDSSSTSNFNEDVANVSVPDPDDRAVPIGSTFGVPVTAQTLAANTDSESANGETAGSTEANASPKKKFALPFKLPNIHASGLMQRLSTSGAGKKHPLPPFVAAGFVLGILMLFVVGYVYLKVTAMAVVAVELKSRPVAKEAEITLDPKAADADPVKLVLPAQVTTKEFESSATIPASGVTLVGEKAKGKVTLFNKTTSTKTFSSGTTVTNGKYTFILDDEVTVASASVTVSGSSETKNYGKADVSVTAAEIGAESNLTKDTELTIASFDSGTYAAAVAEDLSGGSSREVRVVSEADRNKVLAQVKADILKKAEEAFKSESGNGAYTLPTGGMEVTAAEYSVKAGDEAEQVTLSLTANVEAMKYEQDDLKPLAEAILKSEVPEGYELTSEPPNVLSSPAEAASASSLLKLNVNLSAHAKPKVIAENWKTEIAGLGLESALAKLQSKGEIQAVDIQFRPSLVRTLLPVLPAAERITIETK